MRNYIKGQTEGLFWFIVIYALVRYLLAESLSLQNWDMLAIVISVSSLMWLILRHFYSRKKALGLASSLFVVSLFAASLVSGGEFIQTISFGGVTILADKEFFQNIGLGMATISLAYLIIVGISLNSQRQLVKDGLSNIIWALIARMILTFIIIFVLEFYLLPLILVS